MGIPPTRSAPSETALAGTTLAQVALPRRRFLSGLGASALAAGLGSAGLAGCGSNTGRPESGASSSASGAAGPTPALSQWYHEYGENGVEDAVKRYAAAYDKATVTVRWNPGDYD